MECVGGRNGPFPRWPGEAGVRASLTRALR